MTAIEYAYEELKNRNDKREDELQRRRHFENWIGNNLNFINYDELCCLLSWLEHSTLSLDEVLRKMRG